VSRLTRTLIIGATLAAMILGGTTTVALAQTNDDPDGKQAVRRPPNLGQVGESWRHRHTASSRRWARTPPPGGCWPASASRSHWGTRPGAGPCADPT
jgi:hypothetical protein